MDDTCAQCTSTDPPPTLAEWMKCTQRTRSSSGMRKDVVSSQFSSRNLKLSSVFAVSTAVCKKISATEFI